ncbi:MAG TPA: thiamine phosphate synthase [Blastocatellia bacterium]|nr:thiamine phosphate synthase [Blastocatellia bacterium]
MAFTLPRIYPITDTLVSKLSHARQVELLVAGGATLVQLREKRASPREFYHAALEAMSMAQKLGVQLIINDRVDIAIAVKADGVHLGQDDLPPDRARSLLGESRIIGFSTHSLEQALAANSAPVDYVAIGPVFQTSTKERPDPVVGLGAISEIKRRLSRPLVAIGGITLLSASSVIEAGADSVAVISDVLSAGDVAARMRQFVDLLRLKR